MVLRPYPDGCARIDDSAMADDGPDPGGDQAGEGERRVGRRHEAALPPPPGWWCAPDGNWYPPPPASTPPAREPLAPRPHDPKADRRALVWSIAVVWLIIFVGLLYAAWQAAQGGPTVDLDMHNIGADPGGYRSQMWVIVLFILLCLILAAAPIALKVRGRRYAASCVAALLFAALMVPGAGVVLLDQPTTLNCYSCTELGTGEEVVCRNESLSGPGTPRDPVRCSAAAVASAETGRSSARRAAAWLLGVAGLTAIVALVMLVVGQFRPRHQPDQKVSTTPVPKAD